MSWALGNLLHHWAKRYHWHSRNDDGNAKAARSTLYKRLVHYRVATISESNGGKRGKSRQYVPDEFSRDESTEVLSAVREVSHKLKTIRNDSNKAQTLRAAQIHQTVEFEGERFEFVRRFPCPDVYIAQVASQIGRKGNSPMSIATRIVAMRFGIAQRTVTNAKTKTRSIERKVRDRTPVERLLASLYFDVVSFGLSTENKELAASILDSLHNMGYPPIMLFYLVQTAQGLPGGHNGMSSGMPDGGRIRKLTRRICKGKPKMFDSSI